MQTVTEARLIEAGHDGQIELLRIVRVAKGFQVLAKLTGKKEEALLVTQHRLPRVWADLTRLADHIKEKYGDVPLVLLHLRSDEGHDHEQRSPADSAGKSKGK